MKPYQVEVEVTTRHTIEVHAEDGQDAVSKARNMDDCDVVNQASSSELVSIEVNSVERLEMEDDNE
jgi:hypothetical protein